MKLVRILFSLLLASLLPLQGAVAAAMSCPHELTSPQAHEVSQPEDSVVDHEQMLDGEGMEHPPHPSHAAKVAGKCGLCAACCSGAALASSWPTDIRFIPTAAAAFPVTRSLAASFLSDGPERPPRSF